MRLIVFLVWLCFTHTYQPPRPPLFFLKNKQQFGRETAVTWGTGGKGWGSMIKPCNLRTCDGASICANVWCECGQACVTACICLRSCVRACVAGQVRGRVRGFCAGVHEHKLCLQVREIWREEFQVCVCASPRAHDRAVCVSLRLRVAEVRVHRHYVANHRRQERPG